MITLIDADSIIYIVGWNFKDRDPKEPGVLHELGDAIDAFVHGVLQLTQAEEYAGYFSCSTANCFRTKLAKFKPYKGNRPEKPEWIKTWEPHIKRWLIDMWEFVQCTTIEADDAVSVMAHMLSINFPVCIASNDKDLKQIPACHYSYKTKKIDEINAETARETFWLQMLTGDSTDNIAGVPGIGPVKAAKILMPHDPDEYEQVVHNEYIHHFGEEEGTRIFVETCHLVRLLNADDYTHLVGFNFDLHKYDLEGSRAMLQNNPLYNQYYNSSHDLSFSDFL